MCKTAKDLEFLIEQNFDNLADIPDNEDLIIKYLLRRCEKGEVYTWVGKVLLAINYPYSNLNLYDKPHEDYTKLQSTVSHKALIKPHPFALATQVRRRLTHGLGKVNQVIIISGDSGSGKTFSASKILGFLTSTNESQDGVCSRIEKACSVIAAFSTASTPRNKYSSRHGQLVQLQYLNNTIKGAALNSFLLEQNRVTNGTNNFLIFGQMLAGLSEPELEGLKLSRNRSYNLTDIGNIEQADRIKGFEDTVEAMNSLGLLENQRKEIFKIIAFLVHLGNVEFKEGDATGCNIDVTKKDSLDALQNACSLMEFSTPDLVKLLTTNLIRPRSELKRRSVYYSVITSINTCRMRLHSVIRFLYRSLFSWLINQLNDILTCKEDSPNLLGILDIFGIEFFSENSIEQLSINYANEKMQTHFIQKYLEAGRAELEDEGLTSLPPLSTSCIYEKRLAAIERGLFPVLNDACLVARIEQHSSLDHFKLPASEEIQEFVHSRGEIFTIRHYSCLVEYKTEDIICKNIDKIPTELLSMLALCQNKFFQSVIDSEDKSIRITLDKRRNTTLARLKQGMDALIKELDKYDPHYVRCIKLSDGSDDSGIVKQFKEQLACSGILDALPLARCTLPIRLKYEEFEKRYSPQMIVVRSSDFQDPTTICQMILKRVLSEEELHSFVHFGKKLIFLTETALFKLEELRNEINSQCALKIENVLYESKSTIPESSALILDSKNGDRCGTNPLVSAQDIDESSEFLIDVKNRGFFYRNRILSRRRLATIPVRFHTRLTCLKHSHCLPRSELPNGLEDCL